MVLIGGCESGLRTPASAWDDRVGLLQTIEAFIISHTILVVSSYSIMGPII